MATITCELSLKTASGVMPCMLSTCATVSGLEYRTTVFDLRERLAAEAELRQVREELERRVQQRTAELAVVNESLQRRNEELEQFMFAASHDLKAPLSTIAIYTELLQAELGDAASPPVRDSLRFITDGMDRMHRLLHDLLDYCRATTAPPEPAEPLSVADVLTGVLAALRDDVAAAGARITHDELPLVSAGRVHVEQLLHNLLGNAIKYCDPDQPPLVHVTARRDEGRWLFAVRDNGIGIAPQHHEQVFGVFKRLHASRYTGTGIGLAICKKCVEQYGGRIWVESEVGVGSTFYFTLPEASADG